ncbi:expressed protein [Echinococcus multilocularis]|uniref:Expressed protein n=1 Tax=Echinococcus multilocularis TaxID=6211 RepID=A0A068YF04_ECHMU|nr:expressed protein [Echinococcus multilocularis]
MPCWTSIVKLYIDFIKPTVTMSTCLDVDQSMQLFPPSLTEKISSPFVLRRGSRHENYPKWFGAGKTFVSNDAGMYSICGIKNAPCHVEQFCFGLP